MSTVGIAYSSSFHKKEEPQVEKILRQFFTDTKYDSILAPNTTHGNTVINIIEKLGVTYESVPVTAWGWQGSGGWYEAYEAIVRRADYLIIISSSNKKEGGLEWVTKKASLTGKPYTHYKINTKHTPEKEPDAQVPVSHQAP